MGFRTEFDVTLARGRGRRGVMITSRLMRIAVCSVALLATACKPENPFERSVAGVSAAVTQAVANIERNVTPGRHLGFDTYAYPGDDAMLAWRDNSVRYEWVGYYLEAPCHREASWSGKRERLDRMGWGLAVIYVGQQTWGRVPGQRIVRTKYVTRYTKKTVKRKGKKVVVRVRKRVPVRVIVQPRAKPGSSCNAQLITSARGRSDADDAIQKTATEGFARGTIIFLDLERMEAVPRRMREYYQAWTARIVEDGQYRPGYYVHFKNAVEVLRDVKPVLTAAGIAADPPFWIAGGRGFSEDSHPGDVGHAFANVWQGILDIAQTHNGFEIPIDVNVSRVPSPSSYLRGD